MCSYRGVEVYPSIPIGEDNPRPTCVAELNDWKYTFEIHGQNVVALVEISRPWQVGDKTPPDWIPAEAEERVTVDEYTRADLPASVITALLDRNVLGDGRELRIR